MVEKDDIFDKCFGEEAVSRYLQDFPNLTPEQLKQVLENHRGIFENATIHTYIPALIVQGLRNAHLGRHAPLSDDHEIPTA